MQVERALDSSLRSRAVAVISSSHSNGTIISLSAEALQEGLQRGLSVSIARKMSHSVQLLPCNRNLYEQMHSHLYREIARYSPLAEPSFPGQYYLDMTGMNRIYRTPQDAAMKLGRRLEEIALLHHQVGIAPNKLVSAIATEAVAEPLIRIKAGTEPQFLAPLPSGILPVTRNSPVARLLHFLFLREVSDIQEISSDRQTTVALFGEYSNKLSREAYGEDEGMVQPPSMKDHIIYQSIMEQDSNDVDLLRAAVGRLARQLAFQLRSRSIVASKLSLEIHYSDGFQRRRQGTLNRNDDAYVAASTLNLYEKANDRRNRVRSLLIDAEKFKPLARQMDIFDVSSAMESNLSVSLDKLRKRYGVGIIQSGAEYWAECQSRNVPQLPPFRPSV